VVHLAEHLRVVIALYLDMLHCVSCLSLHVWYLDAYWQYSRLGGFRYLVNTRTQKAHGCQTCDADVAV